MLLAARPEQEEQQQQQQQGMRFSIMSLNALHKQQQLSSSEVTNM